MAIQTRQLIAIMLCVGLLSSFPLSLCTLDSHVRETGDNHNRIETNTPGSHITGQEAELKVSSKNKRESGKKRTTMRKRICAVGSVLWGNDRWYVPNMRRACLLLAIAALNELRRTNAINKKNEPGMKNKPDLKDGVDDILDDVDDAGNAVAQARAKYEINRTELFLVVSMALLHCTEDKRQQYYENNKGLLNGIEEGDVREVLKRLTKGADPDGFVDETGENLVAPREIAIDRNNAVVLQILRDYDGLKKVCIYNQVHSKQVRFKQDKCDEKGLDNLASIYLNQMRLRNKSQEQIGNRAVLLREIVDIEDGQGD